MMSGPRAALDPDRLTGEGRRASRTRFEDGGGYLRIPRHGHFSTVTQRTHVPHRPSPHRGPILDDGEQLYRRAGSRSNTSVSAVSKKAVRRTFIVVSP